MRHIDIGARVVDSDWQTRAAAALNQLRSEIAKAERDAIANNQDPSVARRAAISAGLKVASRMKVWQELAEELKRWSHRKCWYSEGIDPTADKNVDHFRPKAQVEEDPTHEGYWWLAFDWKNFRYSSEWCNQRRNDKTSGTSGGKRDHFPVHGSYRARVESDDVDLEEPDLLDPILPNDWKLLTFRSDGRPTPSKAKGTRDFDRAEKSIEVYHLNCWDLVCLRRTLAGEIRRIVEDLETLQFHITNPKIRKVFLERQTDLLRRFHESSPFSTAALAYAKAEVYVLRQGVQEKRDWLETILNERT